MDLNIHIHTSSDRQIRVAVIPSYPTIQTTLQQRRTHYPATHKAHRRRTVLGEAGFMCFGGSGLLGLDLGGAEGVFRRSGVEVVEEKCRWRGEGEEGGRKNEGRNSKKSTIFTSSYLFARKLYNIPHYANYTTPTKTHSLRIYTHTHLNTTASTHPSHPICISASHPAPKPRTSPTLGLADHALH